MLKPVKVAVLGALAVGLVASGCSRVGESQGGQTTSDVSAPITVDFAGSALCWRTAVRARCHAMVLAFDLGAQAR